MTDTLTALDATFLEQLDEGVLMSIGGVMVFDALPGGGVPSADDLCGHLAPRLDQLPRYSERLSSPRTGGLSWPHRSEDERFDIRAHIGRPALPAPGGDSELIVRDEIIGAPRTSLNVPIGSTRRFAVVRVPLSELKAIPSSPGRLGQRRGGPGGLRSLLPGVEALR